MKLTATGNALSLFLAISFTLCVGWGLIAPVEYHMHGAWEQWLPGFTWLSVPSFFIGLIGAYLYGWYIAAVFVPLHNFFGRSRPPVT